MKPWEADTAPNEASFGAPEWHNKAAASFPWSPFPFPQGGEEVLREGRPKIQRSLMAVLQGLSCGGQHGPWDWKPSGITNISEDPGEDGSLQLKKHDGK